MHLNHLLASLRSLIISAVAPGYYYYYYYYYYV